MDPRKVNEQEIKQLMAFAKRKDVFYIDLRLEVVDHLAHSIEELWLTQPDLSFQDALMKVYKGFGIFGFLDIVESHQKMANKRYLTELWGAVKQTLAWPKIMVFILGAWFSYELMSQFTFARTMGLGVFLLIAVIGIVTTLIQHRKNRKILNGETTMLMSGPAGSVVMVYYFMFIPFGNFLPRFITSLEGQWVPLKLSLFILGALLFNLANWSIQEKAKEQLVELKKQLKQYA